MNLKKKIHSAVLLLSYFFKGDFIRFFYESSKFFPDWLFKFNEGVLITTSSPKIISRNYKRYIFANASIDDWEKIERFTGLTKAQIGRRFDADQECYIVRDSAAGGEIVNIIWVNIKPCHITGMGLSLDIEAGAAYLYGGFTSPEARMKGIFNTALKKIYSTLNERGIKKIYALIEYWNKNSYDYHIRLGFKPRKRVIFISLFSIKLTFFKYIDTGKRNCRVFFLAPKDRYVI